MSGCDDYIKKLEETLPEQCSVNDLVAVGIFKSAQAASYARLKRTDFPDYFKIPGRGIFYPKEAIIQFVKQHSHSHA